ncbi:TPA: SsrA-binding protein SmpB [bacterium]|nr:SsrA-binding protein SmpB [bacterium]
MVEVKNIIKNRRAEHDYHILDTYEAGIALEGLEVKSLRMGNISLQDSFAKVEDGEIYLYDAHISPYSHSDNRNYDPKRRRKLLMNKREIRRLWGRTQQSGFTLVPVDMHFNEKGRAKVQIAVAKGKHLYDKRERLKKEELNREKASAMKERNKRD